MGQHYSTITKISVFQIFQCYYICATYCMWGAVAARSLFLWRWGQERGNTNDCKQQLFSFLISMLFIFSIIWLVGLWSVWKWWKMLITRAHHDVLKYLVLSLAQRFSVYWNQKVLTFRSLESILRFILKIIQVWVQYGSSKGRVKDCFFFFWV